MVSVISHSLASGHWHLVRLIIANIQRESTRGSSQRKSRRERLREFWVSPSVVVNNCYPETRGRVYKAVCGCWNQISFAHRQTAQSSYSWSRLSETQSKISSQIGKWVFNTDAQPIVFILLIHMYYFSQVCAWTVTQYQSQISFAQDVK